jgi:hypothetical protein
MDNSLKRSLQYSRFGAQKKRGHSAIPLLRGVEGCVLLRFINTPLPLHGRRTPSREGNFDLRGVEGCVISASLTHPPRGVLWTCSRTVLRTPSQEGDFYQQYKSSEYPLANA